MKKIKAKKIIKSSIIHCLLIVIGFLWAYPFLWMLSSSFKPQKDFFGTKLNLIPVHATFENIVRVWTKANFGLYFMNTVIVTVCSVTLVLIMTRLQVMYLDGINFLEKKY